MQEKNNLGFGNEFGKIGFIVLALAFIVGIAGFSGSIIGAVSSSSNFSLTDASLCINQSKTIMASMAGAGFNVLRVNDSIKEAEATFDTQKIFKERKRNYDFSLVEKYCKEIAKIEEDAYLARDEFNSLLKFYNESIDKRMNASSVDAIVLEIKNELRDERYENVKDLVEKAYSEIIKVQSENTAFNVIYSNTTRSLKIFVVNNWKILASLTILVFVFLLVYKIRISIWLVNRKMEALRLRKKTIKELVMQTQKDYFEYGKMPEGEYNIKTKKFAELIRDIDRQLPLLQEQLAKLESK